MNIFERFFPKDYSDKIQLIKKQFEAKNFDLVIKEGSLIVDKLKPVDRQILIKLLALSHFNKRENEKALPYFEEIASHSTNSDDWFNVTSTAILVKQVDKGMNAFSKAIEFYQKNGTPQNLPIGQMSYYVMQALRDTGEYDLAFIQLMKLKDVYCQLKITDPTFLHMRGLPFLSHVLEASKSILMQQNISEPQLWLKEFASHLDEDGKLVVEKMSTELKK